MNSLEIITQWFVNQCDGDWEHENQIKIETTSNPGWMIKIDVSYTDLSSRSDKDANSMSDSDYFFYEFKNGVFGASGDISKLEFLLDKFADIILETRKT